jgi:hypothetical protein
MVGETDRPIGLPDRLLPGDDRVTSGLPERGAAPTEADTVVGAPEPEPLRGTVTAAEPAGLI